MEKTFCENCRKDVLYNENDICMYSELKGKSYNYYGKIAVCSECNNEVFVSEIDDYNLEQLYNEFRKENNIISLEKIRKIPEKYNVGKRPLSLLLGWGEQTFSRYYDGDMPTKQYSEILQKIYDSPEYFNLILEENKEKISKVTYEKSKIATELLLEQYNFSCDSKINLVSSYILNECEDITPLALQKLLYYVQGFYYSFMDNFIFDEDCEAWVHGPVFRDIYFKYKDYKFDPIRIVKTKSNFKLPVFEKTIIDSIIKNFSCYSGKVLEEFTHAEIPWLITRGDLALSEASDRKIQKEFIADYFKDVREKNDILNPYDIAVYSKKMFEQIANK